MTSDDERTFGARDALGCAVAQVVRVWPTIAPGSEGWHQSVRPELHVYGAGGHGFGMHPQGTSSDHWIDALRDWLEAQG